MYNLNRFFLWFVLLCLPNATLNNAIYRTTEEYRECLDLLWSLCDSLSVDLNGDLGNSLGEKGTKEPNERGRLLLNFADYFNVCPVNLLLLCEGPLVTYNSFCRKYCSTIDYIFLPNCLQDKIIFARTFDFDVDNTSDHQPIIMKLNYHSNGVQLSADRDSVSNLEQKINWSKFNHAFIQANYVAPLLSEIALIDPVDLNHTDKLSEFITTIILKSSLSLVTPGTTGIKKRKHGIYAKLPVNVKESRSLCTSAFESWKQVDFVRGCTEHVLYVTKRKDYRSTLRAFLSQLECDRVKKLCSAVEFDEKSFWKLMKSQRSLTQMSAFLVNGKMITDKYDYSICGLTILRN